MTAGATRDVVTLSGTADVALVELHRPPHNYVDPDVMQVLGDVLEAAAASRRAVVIASEGRSFCAGANFAAGGGVHTSFRDAAARFYEQAMRVFTVPVPLVAAVQGAAVGGGLGLALACDLRVVTPRTRLHANFVRLGIHHGFGLSVTLPALVGPARAADLLLTGRAVPGDKAVQLGLADRCVAEEDLRTAALGLAGEIATAAPLAVARVRATLRAGLVEQVRVALEHELDEQTHLIATADAAEGIAAATERRAPRFEGR